MKKICMYFQLGTRNFKTLTSEVAVKVNCEEHKKSS